MTTHANPSKRHRGGLAAVAAIAALLAGCNVAVQGSAALQAAKPAAKPAGKAAADPPAAAPATVASSAPAADQTRAATPAGVAPVRSGLLLPRRVLPPLPDSLVKLMGKDGAALIGQDGGTLIGDNGAILVGQDGASLVGQDGGSYRLAQASQKACYVDQRTLGDVVRLIRDDLLLVAEVARIPDQVANMTRAFGLPLNVATTLNLFGGARGIGGRGGMASGPQTFFAEALPGGGGGLYIYGADKVDAPKLSGAIKVASSRKGEIWSRRTDDGGGGSLFTLTYDLDGGLAVVECYRDNRVEFPGRTRYRIELVDLSKLKVPAPDGTTFVFRATRRVVPADSSCQPLNYSLLGRFDAAGHASVRLATIDAGETTPKLVLPTGGRSAEPVPGAAFFLGADGKLAAGTPDEAAVKRLPVPSDMLPIPDLSGPDSPDGEAVFTPPRPETEPTGSKSIGAEEILEALASGAFDVWNQPVSGSADDGFGVTGGQP